MMPHPRTVFLLALAGIGVLCLLVGVGVWASVRAGNYKMKSHPLSDLTRKSVQANRKSDRILEDVTIPTLTLPGILQAEVRETDVRVGIAKRILEVDATKPVESSPGDNEREGESAETTVTPEIITTIVTTMPTIETYSTSKRPKKTRKQNKSKAKADGSLAPSGKRFNPPAQVVKITESDALGLAKLESGDSVVPIKISINDAMKFPSVEMKSPKLKSPSKRIESASLDHAISEINVSGELSPIQTRHRPAEVPKIEFKADPEQFRAAQVAAVSSLAAQTSFAANHHPPVPEVAESAEVVEGTRKVGSKRDFVVQKTDGVNTEGASGFQLQIKSQYPLRVPETNRDEIAYAVTKVVSVNTEGPFGRHPVSPSLPEVRVEHPPSQAAPAGLPSQPVASQQPSSQEGPPPARGKGQFYQYVESHLSSLQGEGFPDFASGMPFQDARKPIWHDGTQGGFAVPNGRRQHPLSQEEGPIGHDKGLLLEDVKRHHAVTEGEGHLGQVNGLLFQDPRRKDVVSQGEGHSSGPKVPAFQYYVKSPSTMQGASSKEQGLPFKYYVESQTLTEEGDSVGEPRLPFQYVRSEHVLPQRDNSFSRDKNPPLRPLSLQEGFPDIHVGTPLENPRRPNLPPQREVTSSLEEDQPLQDPRRQRLQPQGEGTQSLDTGLPLPYPRRQQSQPQREDTSSLETSRPFQDLGRQQLPQGEGTSRIDIDLPIEDLRRQHSFSPEEGSLGPGKGLPHQDPRRQQPVPQGTGTLNLVKGLPYQDPRRLRPLSHGDGSLSLGNGLSVQEQRRQHLLLQKEGTSSVEGMPFQDVQRQHPVWQGAVLSDLSQNLQSNSVVRSQQQRHEINQNIKDYVVPDIREVVVSSNGERLSSSGQAVQSMKYNPNGGKIRKRPDMADDQKEPMEVDPIDTLSDEQVEVLEDYLNEVMEGKGSLDDLPAFMAELNVTSVSPEYIKGIFMEFQEEQEEILPATQPRPPIRPLNLPPLPPPPMPPAGPAVVPTVQKRPQIRRVGRLEPEENPYLTQVSTLGLLGLGALLMNRMKTAVSQTPVETAKYSSDGLLSPLLHSPSGDGKVDSSFEEGKQITDREKWLQEYLKGTDVSLKPPTEGSEEKSAEYLVSEIPISGGVQKDARKKNAFRFRRQQGQNLQLPDQREYLLQS